MQTSTVIADGVVNRSFISQCALVFLCRLCTVAVRRMVAVTSQRTTDVWNWTKLLSLGPTRGQTLKVKCNWIEHGSFRMQFNAKGGVVLAGRRQTETQKWLSDWGFYDGRAWRYQQARGRRGGKSRMSCVSDDALARRISLACAAVDRLPRWHLHVCCAP